MDRVYGIKMGWEKSLNDVVNTLATGESLRMFDPETLQMTIDTPAWNSLIETAQSVLSSNALFFESDLYNEDGYVNYDGDWYSRDPFYSGRLAMRLDGNYLINELENLKNYAQNPDDLISNWDMVTAPVSSGNPDESSYISYSNIFAINNTSTNVDAAWDFIGYITGDDYARVKSKVTYGNLPLRTAYLANSTERNYDAFYKVRPSTQNMNIDYTKIPQVFQFEFYTLMNEELNKVNEGQASISEVLSTLQIKGNEMLTQGVMTEEEMEEYWKDKYGEDGGGVVRPLDIVEEAAGEATVTEEVVE